MPTDRYRTVGPHRLRCDPAADGCGREFTKVVTIDVPSGVAGVMCPHCGAAQEPNRIDD